MPDKLNLTDLLVNYDRFKRTMLWIEYHANADINVDENCDDEEKPKNILKSQKTNLPPNDHPTPSELKIFLNGVQSEIKDPGNRNKARPNLPKDEAKALVELVRLQSILQHIFF